LTSAVSARAGETAKIAASQGRRRCTPVRNQVASSATAARPSALTTTKSRDSAVTVLSAARACGDWPYRSSMSGDPLSQWVTQAVPQAQ